MISYVLKGSSLRTLGLGLFLSLGSMSFAAKGQGSELAISRSIEKTGERQYLVTVDVKKGDLKGYAKLEEMIPESFVASKKETRSANYIFQGGKAKFIWMELPSASEFKVAYKLIQKQSKAGNYTITGRLSCVSGEDLLRVRDTSSFEVETPKALAQESSGPEEEGSGASEANEDDDGGKRSSSEGTEGKGKEGEEDLAATGSGTEENDEGKAGSEAGDSEEQGTAAASEEEEGMREDNGSSEPEKNKSGGATESEAGKSEGSDLVAGNAYFSVQIGAFSEKKSDRYFEEQYGISDADIHHYQEGELYKYSLGHFSSYQKANDKKKELRSGGLQGAFVVGFKGGDPVKVSALRK